MSGLLYSEALPANPPWQNSCLHKSIFGDGGNHSIQRKPWTDMLLVKRKTRLSCRQEFSNIFLQSKAMCILFWFENKMASSHSDFDPMFQIFETSQEKEFSSECLTEMLLSYILELSVVKYDILSNNRCSKLHAVINCLFFIKYFAAVTTQFYTLKSYNLYSHQFRIFWKRKHFSKPWQTKSLMRLVLFIQNGATIEYPATIVKNTLKGQTLILWISL